MALFPEKTMGLDIIPIKNKGVPVHQLFPNLKERRVHEYGRISLPLPAFIYDTLWGEKEKKPPKPPGYRGGIPIEYKGIMNYLLRNNEKFQINDSELEFAYKMARSDAENKGFDVIDFYTSDELDKMVGNKDGAQAGRKLYIAMDIPIDRKLAVLSHEYAGGLLEMSVPGFKHSCNERAVEQKGSEILKEYILRAKAALQ